MRILGSIAKNVAKLALYSYIPIFLYSFVSTVHAQANFSITAFPAIIDQRVEPNQQTRLLVQFKNNSDKTIIGSVKVANYTIKNKEGDIMLVDDPNVKLKYAAASWITPDVDQIAIPANNYVAVNLTVKTPAELNTCGNYAIAYFEYDQGLQPGASAITQSSSTLAAKIGSLINLSTVSKSCVEKVTVSSFKYPGFLEFGPVKVDFDLLNSGNVHAQPMGKLVLRDMLNNVVEEVKLKDQRIFPETAKAYSGKIGPQWLLGRFAIELKAVYGENNTPLTHTAYLWIIPWRLVVVVLLALLIVAIILRSIFGKVVHREEELETKLKEEEKEIDELKKILRGKKE
ncbi:MAG: hypothetical protein WC775_04975 [Patescibacteria group bacterium]|jgi:hypothetical protein